MKKSELFELRKKRHINFTNLKDLSVLLNNLLTQEYHVPVVVGYDRPTFEKDWKIHLLKPATNSDELTIRNFLEGLKRIEIGLLQNPDLFKDFNGSFRYSGIEQLHYSEYDSLIIEVQLGLGEYLLDRKYNLDIIFNSGGYSAISKIYPTFLDQIMEDYMGPKRMIQYSNIILNKKI